MDLEKIEQHLQDKLYDDLDEFCADMLLMFENCRTYNAPDTIFYDAANRLQVSHPFLRGEQLCRYISPIH